MKEILDTIAMGLGYIIFSFVLFYIVLCLYIKIQDAVDTISYKIWLRKRKKESEE